VLKLYPEGVKTAGSNSGTIKWRASRGNLDRMLRPIPDYLDGSKELMTQIELVKRNSKRNKSCTIMSVKDNRELETQCNISIFPEKTCESLPSPVLVSSKSMKVSLVRVPKPSVVESPISSPNVTDVDEPFSQNLPSLRKPYKRRGSRRATHPRATHQAIESPTTNKAYLNKFLSSPQSVRNSTQALRAYTHNAQFLSPHCELPNQRIRKILSDNTDIHRSVEVLDFEPGPPRILIIESSEISRLAIGEQIKRILECEQDMGEDGEEAVKEYLNYSKNGFMYFFILMEILMSNLDGYQATKMIRSIERKHGFPRTYIVGLSSEENPDSKYFDCGMDYLIKKPSTVEEFSKMVTERKYLLGTD
jgi:CheY-like chemotaxis protein